MEAPKRKRAQQLCRGARIGEASNAGPMYRLRSKTSLGSIEEAEDSIEAGDSSPQAAVEELRAVEMSAAEPVNFVSYNVDEPPRPV